MTDQLRFSFIISACSGNEARIHKIIDSVEAQGIEPENYEVIVIGGNINSTIGERARTRVLNIYENVRQNWITCKKNCGVKIARFDNLVLLHDYIALDPGWYSGFCSWNSIDPSWRFAVTPLFTADNQRWGDFTIYPPYLMYRYPSFAQRCLLPYDFVVTPRLSQYMYVSGAYCIVKRDLALIVPLNENLSWGEGEDLEWCARLNEFGIVIRCNPLSSARFIKPLKEPAPDWHAEVDSEQLSILKELS